MLKSVCRCCVVVGTVDLQSLSKVSSQTHLLAAGRSVEEGMNDAHAAGM